MLLYLVRHGETLSNRERRYLTAQTPLSADGEVQAGHLAERLRTLDIAEIWSSPMRRAKHTAEIVNQYHDLPITELDELREIRRPSEMQGHLSTEPSIQPIRALLEAHRSDPYYSYQDGESFASMVGRAKAFLTHAEKIASGKDNAHLVLVTAHGIILSAIVLCALLQEAATPELVSNTIEHMSIKNTGISVISINEGKWKVITLNDHAHL